jgi:Protein of unknown function (DUF3616)
MPFDVHARIVLDYAGAATTKLLTNLSGIATTNGALWTVSDEGRTVECLALSPDGFTLRKQFALDDFIPGMPGSDTGDELDLESIDIADDQLWLCGSHCRVRKKPDFEDRINPEFRSRPSRCLLAAIELTNGGTELGTVQSLPFKGEGSLRRHLEQNGYLQPFVNLPSKENGLDIEGFVWRDGSALLGLRGPLVDSIAVVAALRLSKKMAIKGSDLCFLDLGGLGIRDLARDGADVLVLAGPVSAASGPFRLYRWAPQSTDAVQKPELLFTWPQNQEKPEGICIIERNGRKGILTVYDSPDETSRIDGHRYATDWLTVA